MNERVDKGELQSLLLVKCKWGAAGKGAKKGSPCKQKPVLILDSDNIHEYDKVLQEDITHRTWRIFPETENKTGK